MYLLTRLFLICGLGFGSYLLALAAWLCPWAVFLVAAGALWCNRRPLRLSAHGTAEWADLDHVKSNGLTSGTGLCVGEMEERP